MKNLLSKLGAMKYVILLNACLLGLGVIFLDKQAINVLLTWSLEIVLYGVFAVGLLLMVISQLSQKSIRKIKKFLYN